MTGTTQIPHAINNYYDRMLLVRALPLLLHTSYGQVRDIPRNNTQTIKFRKYSSLSLATTPLTEGVTPTGSALSTTDITAIVLQYGDYITLTDVVQLTTLDPVLTETAALLGEQAGQTIDVVCRNVLHAGTNVQYADGVASRVLVDTANKIDATEVRTAVKVLKNANAPKLNRMVSANQGYATTPVNSTYVGIIHPDTTFDLEDETGWAEVSKYADSAGTLLPGEVGKLGDVRFVETTYAKVFAGEGAGGIDVYSTLILGRDAYGITRISGEAMRNIVKPLGSGGTNDPLDQRSTSGWKAWFVAKILQQLFMLRIEHSVS